MTDKDEGLCHEFHHIRGYKHTCHRDEGHRSAHHSDGGLLWGGHAYPNYGRPRLTDRPCPECEPISSGRSNPKR